MDTLRVIKLPLLLGATVGAFLTLPIVVQTVVALMIIDLIAGVITAAVTASFSGRALGIGMLKKVFVLLILLATGLLARGVGEQYGFDASVVLTAVGGAYCFYEFRSILKSAARCKLPVPQWLIDKLALIAKDSAEGSVDDLPSTVHASMTHQTGGQSNDAASTNDAGREP